MSDFESRLYGELKDGFGATNREAREIAEMAVKFRNETDSEITPTSLVEEMEKVEENGLITAWDTVVGRLHLSSWGDSTGTNPYQIEQ